MKNKKVIIFLFFLVPILSSIISMFHLVRLLELGNPLIMGIFLTITVEIGALVSFLVGSSKDILKKIKRGYVIFIFLILFILQVFGNIFYSFDYVSKQLLIDPTWLNTFMDMMLGVLDLQLAKFTISLLLGVPVPLISIILLKSASDYIEDGDEPDNKNIKSDNIKKDAKIEKEITNNDKNNTISQPYM